MGWIWWGRAPVTVVRYMSTSGMMRFMLLIRLGCPSIEETIDGAALSIKAEPCPSPIQNIHGERAHCAGPFELGEVRHALLLDAGLIEDIHPGSNLGQVLVDAHRHTAVFEQLYDGTGHGQVGVREEMQLDAGKLGQLNWQPQLIAQLQLS